MLYWSALFQDVLDSSFSSRLSRLLGAGIVLQSLPVSSLLCPLHLSGTSGSKDTLLLGPAPAKPDPDPPIHNIGWFTQGYQLHPATFTPQTCVLSAKGLAQTFLHSFLYFTATLFTFLPPKRSAVCLFTSETFYLPPPLLMYLLNV